MKPNPFAETLLESLSDAERQSIEEAAGAIAAAWGRDVISVADVRAALNCPDPAFLPEPGEYVEEGE